MFINAWVSELGFMHVLGAGFDSPDGLVPPLDFSPERKRSGKEKEEAVQMNTRLCLYTRKGRGKYLI